MVLFFYIIHMILRGSFALSLNGKSPVEASSLVSGDIVYIIMGKFEDKSTTASETSSTDDKTLQVSTDIYWLFLWKILVFPATVNIEKVSAKSWQTSRRYNVLFPWYSWSYCQVEPVESGRGVCCSDAYYFFEEGVRSGMPIFLVTFNV